MSRLPRLSALALTALLVTPWVASAQDDKTGAGFYPFRGSARTVGLAGAFAIADDAAGLNFNPAGMSQIQDRQAEVDLKVNAPGEDYLRLAYVEPIREHKLGGALSFIDANDGTGRKDRIYQLTYGQEWRDGMAFGVNVRYQEVKIPGAKGTGFGFDLGVLYTPENLPDWSIGAAVLNVNEPSFRGIGLFKRVYNLGVAYRPDKWTTLGLDWFDIGSVAHEGQIRFGGERALTENISVRAGVAQKAFGVGLSLMFKQFTFDYGFQHLEGAPDLNLISLLANF
ncbi:MAG: hypothetical protein HYU66_16980 [Armatimonadetes bacterium]|nr:hypothetical protein [Armatimonadota bacterium]